MARRVDDVIPLVLIGAGGHASDVLACVEAINAAELRFDVLGAVDDDPSADGHRLVGRGVPVLGSIPGGAHVTIAVGDPGARLALAARFTAHEAAVLVHPTAEVGAGASIALGCQVLGGAHVSPYASLGPHVLVSYLAAVGHDTSLGAGSSVMPAAMLSGGCRIGQGVLIGSNATVLEGITIGDGARIGAGAVVTRDVAEGVTVRGVPAR